MSGTCPQCGAERGHFFDCPIGGLPKPEPKQDTAPLSPWGEGKTQSLNARLIALPIVLVLTLLLSFTGAGRFVLTVLFAMWLHEFGHAISAWLCGAFALPLPWFTIGGASRSVLFMLVEFGSLAYLLWRYRARAWPAAVVLIILLIGVLIPAGVMEQFIVFSGDGGALVLGTLLMLTILLPDEARLSRGGLRWGFLVIGASAWSVTFTQWFSAWRDPAEIPFGKQEGGALSDATRLVDHYAWSEAGLIRAYLVLSVFCLVALAALVALRTLRSRSA